ncbi:MAG TPA: hypothetical protein VF365_00950 [Candidatus Limnocylindria bacterium]
MGVLFQIVLLGIFVGGLAALPFLLYRRMVLHRLARMGPRPAAYLVAAVTALAMLSHDRILRIFARATGSR